MDTPTDSKPESAGPASRSVPGPPSLRHYPKHQLVAWQPQGVLDDALLDEIADWLVVIEKTSLPFKRYVDLSQLASIAIRTRHMFEFAQRRAKEYAGIEPIRSAVFCEDWVGFGVARLYESLMESTHIQVRAFRDRARAAAWLEVPDDVLTLQDEPLPPGGTGGGAH